MYESYFGLTGKPFQLNPDPSFYFGSRGHKRAFAYLEYGLYQSEGFIVITGEIGAGKTTIVRSLLEQLDSGKVVAAQLVSTQLDAEDMLRAVAVAFGLPVKSLDKALLLASIEAFLCQCAVDKKRVLLVVDEAQNLTQRAVEELRMLSNFQLGDRALLQSFLVGQPELRDMMRSPQMQQLRQRVIASYHLGPLDKAEARSYIEHRLKHVGWSGDPHFDLEAFDLIHTLTGGIPRRINTLCNRMMLAAYLAEQHTLGANDVHAIAREIRDELGPDAGLTHVAVVGGSAVDSPLSARLDPGALQRHFDHLEERIDRLEKTVSAAVDLLHKLLHPERATKPRLADGALMDRPTSTPGPLMCVVGARPNYMKMAPLVRALAARAELPRAVLVHTGQHYDVAMNEKLFADLELPAPDINLEAGSGTHAVQTGEIMRRFEPVVDELQPCAVIVVGDVNSTLACSLVATKKQIPVVHVEAGLRSFDRGMPEEINRILTDQIADLLYTTERLAADNLQREGIASSRIRFVGNLMIDSLMRHRQRAVSPRTTLAREGVPGDPVGHAAGYAVATLHRPSNVDDPAALRESLAILRAVALRLPVVWPVHPRARANIERFGLSDLMADCAITLLPPQGYLEMLGLMGDARMVLTDSGGIQEETTALAVPCLTMRDNTERPITVEQGTNTLVGRDLDLTLQCVDAIFAGGGKRGRAPELWDGHAGDRIAADLSAWLGLAEVRREVINA